MEEIKNLLNEKKINQDIRNLFAGMNYENSNEIASIQDYEEIGVIRPEETALAETKILWSELNRQLCEQVKDKPEELKNLKLACCRCLTQDFDKLDSPPLYEDYKRLKFLKSERIINTKLTDGRNQRIIKGNNFLFECECCGARNCIAIEGEVI